MARQISNLTGKKIGLLGGSFNPPHTGHTGISETAIDKLKLDEVWWIVTENNPFKNKDTIAPLEIRLEKCKQINSENPKVKIKYIENFTKSNFAIDTINYLTNQYPEHKFMWLMGSDNIPGFDKWYKPDEFLKSVPIAIFNRENPHSKDLETKHYNFLKDYVIELNDHNVKNIFNADLPAIIFCKDTNYKASATEIRSKIQSLKNKKWWQ